MYVVVESNPDPRSDQAGKGGKRLGHTIIAPVEIDKNTKQTFAALLLHFLTSGETLIPYLTYVILGCQDPVCASIFHHRTKAHAVASP